MMDERWDFRKSFIPILILFLLFLFSHADAEAAKKRKKKRHKPVATAGPLTANDVKQIIAQAVTQAESVGFTANIAIVDKEGNLIGAFKMAGARDDITFSDPRGNPAPGPLCCQALPIAAAAAKTKAGTGAFLSSQGMAFTSRTASFIVQQHFPPGIDFTGSGPLFGVQFSQLLCSDVNDKLPIGLSADPGGLPIYKNGELAGGIGVEGDGKYTFDDDPRDFDQPVEESVALAGTRGFEPPANIRGDQIIVNGIRFPFVNTPFPSPLQLPSFDQLRGTVTSVPRDAFPSEFHLETLDGVTVRVDPRFFPIVKDGSVLTKDEVQGILVQGVKQANITRAAIRQPLGSAAEVNLTVVDVDGKILGIVSTPDAPVFGFDVSAQKARTAAFFSRTSAAADLRAAGFGKYADAAGNDGLRLDGSVAFSDRAVGFLSRPFFPDDIEGTEHGPFSVSIDQFNPFNTGLQIDLLAKMFLDLIKGILPEKGKCVLDANGNPIEGLGNGIQIFPGSVPLYKGGRFAGAVGVSGDGVDQDDLISAMASAGFEAPSDIRSDRVFVRKVRLPFVKFPRNPNL